MKNIFISSFIFLSVGMSASNVDTLPGSSCKYISVEEGGAIQFKETGLTNSDFDVANKITCPIPFTSHQEIAGYMTTLKNITLDIINQGSEQATIDCTLDEYIASKSMTSYAKSINLDTGVVRTLSWNEIEISSNASTFSIQCSLPASTIIAALSNSADLSETDSCPHSSAFSSYSDLVSTSCDEEYLNITTTTGLPRLDNIDPRDRPMVGITSWINRVAVPFLFNWKIPRTPEILDGYSLATARGPIALAVNGVPIFHYERRPDASTHPDDYDPASDTVLAGELDQCGGHAGQGEDYHYHYAPVCLLDEHDLDMPIAYGLDGIPIYYGSGGTDYYGSARYNDINLIDEQTLDLCNAKTDSAGDYRYYTTNSPPYLLGCHRGRVDPSLQINVPPFPLRQQGTAVPEGAGQFGESIKTVVTDFYLSTEGYYHLEHEVSGKTESVIYKKTSVTEDCWEFEHRSEVDVVGTTQNACR